MISRLLAVGREMIMSKYFGAGFATDAFNAAFRVPNLLRDLFAEGALSSAFLPTFVRYRETLGERDAWELASRIINVLSILLAAATLLFFFGARWFIYLLAAPFEEIPGKFELAVLMTRIMSPFVLCTGIAAALMGMLNANGKFFVPALAPAAFNVCSILAGIYLRSPLQRLGIEPVVSMAIGALAGGIAQVALQSPSVLRLGYRHQLLMSFRDPGVRTIVRLMVPAIIGLSATQINIAVDTQLAAGFGNGPVSYLNYAFRFMQLPIGLFGVAIATGAMTAISVHAAKRDMVRLSSTALESLRLAACLTLPAAIGLMIFRREVIQLLYQRGAFLVTDTIQTSHVLFLYAFALFSYSGVKILVPAFYALNDSGTPVRTSIGCIALKIALNFLLILRMGFLGLALATALASWANFVWLVRKFLLKTGCRWTRSEWREYSRITAAALTMGALAFLAHRGAQTIFPLAGTPGLALHLGIAIMIGMASILPLYQWFGVEAAKGLIEMTGRMAGRQR
jgi:putative peptidoglycan lipid II flippase